MGLFDSVITRVRCGERVVGGGQRYVRSDSVAGHRAGDALRRRGDVEDDVVADELGGEFGDRGNRANGITLGTKSWFRVGLITRTWRSTEAMPALLRTFWRAVLKSSASWSGPALARAWASAGKEQAVSARELEMLAPAIP